MRVRRFYGLGGRAPVRYCGEGHQTTYATKAAYVRDDDGDIVDVEEDYDSEEEVSWGRMEWDAVEDDATGTPREVAEAFLRRMHLGRDMSPENAILSDAREALTIYFDDENPSNEEDNDGQGETIYKDYAEATLRRCDGKPLSKPAMRRFFEALYEGTRGSGYAGGPRKPSWYPYEMKPRAWFEAEERERRQQKRFKTRTRAHVGWEFDGLAGRTAFPRCVVRFTS